MPRDCRLVRADPGFEPLWQEVEEGHWRRECQCGAEDYRESPPDRRVRLDPLDPATSRHLGQCQYASETDPAVIRLALRVKPGLGEGYDWVECIGCEVGWQLPHTHRRAQRDPFVSGARLSAEDLRTPARGDRASECPKTAAVPEVDIPETYRSRFGVLEHVRFVELRQRSSKSTPKRR